MDAEEINGLVWDMLASKGQALTSEEVARETGQSNMAARSSLGRLRQANLVEVSTDTPARYLAILSLDAMRWAQAVNLGVTLLSLERHAGLSSSARAQALKMATDGSLDQMEEKARAEKRRSREAVIKGRAASKAAASDLARILEDTNAALNRVKTGEEQTDDLVAQLLEQANTEAKKALDGLVKSLSNR